MGESFTSFEANWLHFLQRDEPLEVFSDQFPESPCVLAGWFIALDPALWPAMEALQRSLRPVDWLRPYPVHLQHLWIGSLGWATSWPTEAIEKWVEQGREALRDLGTFAVDLPRLNCFHNAVVAEAAGDGGHVAELAHRLLPEEDLSTFLPHLAVALPTAAGDPRELREILVPLRESHLGRQAVDHVRLGLVPLSRCDVLQPWTVPASIRLA
jgi:hypothetical protein